VEEVHVEQEQSLIELKYLHSRTKVTVLSTESGIEVIGVVYSCLGRLHDLSAMA
jgi:hypothetical protein